MMTIINYSIIIIYISGFFFNINTYYLVEDVNTLFLLVLITMKTKNLALTKIYFHYAPEEETDLISSIYYQ